MESTAVNQAQHTENVQDLQALNEQLRDAVEQKDERIQALEQQLNWFKRQLFGEKFETRDMTDNP
jgi:predicted RNase H-like nuclease (RuvC/YqgF family)